MSRAVLVDTPRIVRFLGTDPDSVTARASNVAIRISPLGSQGPQGPQGPPGGASFIHEQTTPAATWTITHGLGEGTSTTVVDDNDLRIFPTVDYVNATTTTVTHASPRTGRAFIR